MTRVPFIDNWLKKAALEVQEYVRLIGAFFQAAVSPPIYRYDIIEQFDAIGVASLTVVLLTGFFTDAPVTDYDSATQADTDRYARYHAAMLEQGIYLAPSQFEAAFVSLAHADQDLERTAEAAARAMAGLGA